MPGIFKWSWTTISVSLDSWLAILIPRLCPDTESEPLSMGPSVETLMKPVKRAWCTLYLRPRSHCWTLLLTFYKGLLKSSRFGVICPQWVWVPTRWEHSPIFPIGGNLAQRMKDTNGCFYGNSRRITSVIQEVNTHQTWVLCHASNVSVSSNAYMEILLPTVVVSGKGVIGASARAFINGVSTLIKELLLSFPVDIKEHHRQSTKKQLPSDANMGSALILDF